MIHQAYVPVIVWIQGFGSHQHDYLHIFNGPFDITPHLEFGPDEAANFLGSYFKFILHLPWVGNFVDVCDSFLVLQTILSLF